MAPLSPEWAWRQTDTTVTVNAKVTSVAKKHCDVFLSDRFLKINAPPYLLALDLAECIDEERSTATVSKGHVTVHMMKAVRGNWDGLCLTLNAKNKDEVLKRRRQSIERAYEKAKARRRERQALHEKEKKDAQDRSFELDKRKRRAIDEAKEKELTSAREEISRFAFTQETSATTSRVTFADSDLEDDELDIDEVDSERTVEEEEEEEEEIIVLPPPRQTLPSVAVEFTPTIVETLPAREGREEELKLIRKSQGGGDSDNASDTDLAERHPAFLKDKGTRCASMGTAEAPCKLTAVPWISIQTTCCVCAIAPYAT